MSLRWCTHANVYSRQCHLATCVWIVSCHIKPTSSISEDIKWWYPTIHPPSRKSLTPSTAAPIPSQSVDTDGVMPSRFNTEQHALTQALGADSVRMATLAPTERAERRRLKPVSCHYDRDTAPLLKLSHTRKQIPFELPTIGHERHAWTKIISCPGLMHHVHCHRPAWKPTNKLAIISGNHA
jgi:hypothetical protein